MATPLQFTAPATARPVIPPQQTRSALMAHLLEQSAPDDMIARPPQSVGEGIARTAGMGLDALMAKRVIGTQQAEQQQKLNDFADLLEGVNPELAAAARKGVGLDVASQVLANKYAPPKPTERWVDLTTPEDRLAAGIPATETRPVQRRLDTGELKIAGSGGVSIDLGGGPMTPGRKKADETFAADYVEWSSGGYTDAQRQIAQLEGVVQKLESGGQDNLSGPIIGAMPDWLGTVVNPEGVDTREAVEEVVQRNLRLILGAQFTAAEGERLIARAYNPRLQEKDNAPRVRRLLDQIKQAAAAKQSAADYFAENGTLTGWEGKLPSIGDFDAAIEGDGETGKPPPASAPATPATAMPGTANAAEPPAPAIPPGAIDMLRSNPSLATEFDKKYGAGASTRILNGG